MTTRKNGRITISLKSESIEYLKVIKKNEGVPISTQIQHLIDDMIEELNFESESGGGS